MEQARRALTPGEMALAREAFGRRLDYDRLTLIAGAGRNLLARAAFRQGNGAITLRRSIYFDSAYYRPDFSAGGADDKGLLIHELTHVWQYRRLGVPAFFACYVRDFCACGFSADRMYDYAAGESRFVRARLEAQAQMAGDYGAALARADGEAQRRLQVSLRGSGLFGL